MEIKIIDSNIFFQSLYFLHVAGNYFLTYVIVGPLVSLLSLIGGGFLGMLFFMPIVKIITFSMFWFLMGLLIDGIINKFKKNNIE